MSCLHSMTFSIKESRFLSNFPSNRSVLEYTEVVKTRGKNRLITLFIFISFFGCAPTVIETTKKPTKDEVVVVEEKKEEVTIQQEKEIAPVAPLKPENKFIDFNSIDKIVVILSDDNLLTPIFYESFISEIENYPNIPKIDFIYSLTELNSNIDNSLIIGPISTSDLRELPQHLGKNTFILIKPV